MRFESTIIERVETLIRHPTFAGSDGVMETVLDDLESRACAHQIGRATYRRLREMILRSPHFARTHWSTRPRPELAAIFARHPRPQSSSRPSGEMVAFERRIVDHGRKAGSRRDVAGDAFPQGLPTGAEDESACAAISGPLRLAGRGRRGGGAGDSPPGPIPRPPVPRRGSPQRRRSAAGGAISSEGRSRPLRLP